MTNSSSLATVRWHRAALALALTVAACSESPTSQGSMLLVIASGNAQGGEVGSALPNPLVVRVTRNGVGAAGVAVHWNAEEGSGDVAVADSVTDADGYASVQRRLGPRAGTYETTAAIRGSHAATVRFTSYAQIFGATHLLRVEDRFEGGEFADTIGAVLQPYSVRLMDYLFQPVQGVPVHWTPDRVVTLTDRDGIARYAATLGTVAGPYQTQAEVPGLVGSPIVFDAMALPGNPVALKILAGDGQVGATMEPLKPYMVEAIDRHGNAVAGVTVEWRVTGTDGTLSRAHVVTAVDSAVHETRAVASVVHTLGAAEGPMTATATALDVVGTPLVTFSSIAVSAIVNVWPDPGYGDWDYGRTTPYFHPHETEIVRGSTVGWIWYGKTCDVVFEDDPNPPSSAAARSVGHHTRMFHSAGEYRYRCTTYSDDFDSGMAGVVRVR